MQFNKSDTALVVIDPQNDVLSEKGVSWALVGQSVKENNTVEHLAPLSLSLRPSVAIRRSRRKDDAGRQGIFSPRSHR